MKSYPLRNWFTLSVDDGGGGAELWLVVSGAGLLKNSWLPVGLFSEVGNVPGGAEGSKGVAEGAVLAVGRVIGRFCLVSGFLVLDLVERGAGATAGLNIIGGAFEIGPSFCSGAGCELILLMFRLWT